MEDGKRGPTSSSPLRIFLAWPRRELVAEGLIPSPPPLPTQAQAAPGSGDILANEASRVRLSTAPGKSDYINAAHPPRLVRMPRYWIVDAG